MLQTGGVRAYFPWIPTYTENTTSETTPDEMAPVYSVNWISTTTSSISYNSTISSAQIPLPNTTAVRNPPYDYYLMIGPMIYLNFSTANTTDAGFTVDLLFQHPSYFKASWPILLYYLYSDQQYTRYRDILSLSLSVSLSVCLSVYLCEFILSYMGSGPDLNGEKPGAK